MQDIADIQRHKEEQDYDGEDEEMMEVLGGAGGDEEDNESDGESQL